MDKKKKSIIIGLIVGMVVGRMMFNGFEEMGWSIFVNGDLRAAERLQMALFSSGALKIWGGAIIGAIVGSLIPSK